MRDNSFKDIRTNNGRSFISAKQLKYAKTFVNQLVHTESSVLVNLKFLHTNRKKAVSAKIHQLANRTLKILRYQVVYNRQLTRYLYRLQFQLHKIVIIERFTNVQNWVLSIINQAVLTSEQKSKNSKDVSSLYQYVLSELEKVQEMAAFQPIFTSGVNALNGVLSKYISQSQMCILAQVQKQANQVENEVDSQPNLSVMAKYIATRHVNAALGEAKRDLMITTNFNGLRSIQECCLKELKGIASDENRSLNNLTAFNKFANHMTDLITQLSRLSTDVRLQLKALIVKRHREVNARVQKTDQGITNEGLRIRENRLSSDLILAVSKGYKHEISLRTADFSKKQRRHLKKYLDRITKDLVKSIKSSKNIELLVKKSLHQINFRMTKRENQIIYQNRVNQLIKDFVTRIDNQYELRDSDKRGLQSQVITYGHQSYKKRLPIDRIRQYLDKWLRDQNHYLLNSMLQKRIVDLNREIQFSHLSGGQKRGLLRRLKKARKSKASYNDRRLLVKAVHDYGLSLDKSTNLHQLQSLNKLIYQQIRALNITPEEGKHLSNNFEAFSRRINGIKKISTIDHLKLTYEKRILSYLCHPKLDVDSLKVKALQFPITQAKRSHHHIHMMVLDRSLSLYIDDRIDLNLCQYLESAIPTNNVHFLKHKLVKITRKINNIMSWAFSWIKSSYIHENDTWVLVVYHQLIAYAPSRQILDRIETINSRSSGNINNAGDLLHVESAKQNGDRVLNAYANGLIGKIDSNKAAAHRKIGKYAATLQKQLQASQVGSESSNAKLISFNRILKIVNRYSFLINQDLVENIDMDCERCQDAMRKALRQIYREEWVRLSMQAQRSIQHLVNVPIDPKMSAISSLQHRESYVNQQLRECDEDRLPNILSQNKAYIYQIVRHGIYLNPTKHRLRDHLDHDLLEIRHNLDQYTNDGIKKQTLKRFKRLNIRIDQQILNGDDRHVKGLYKVERKRLATIELKAIRKAQLKSFNVEVKKIEHQLHQLSLLSNNDGNHADMQFNKYYHKFIYKLAHAKAIKVCIDTKQQGIKAFKQILNHNREIDEHKRNICKPLFSKVKNAKSQIGGLNDLQKKDKNDSFRLLKQIRQQTIQNIKNAKDHKAIQKALKSGGALVKQVIDKVSSAGVLVSAIQTANKQIAGSTLDPKQKQATLHQINKIISSGIQNQFSNPDLKSLHDSKQQAPKSRSHHENYHSVSRQASKSEDHSQSHIQPSKVGGKSNHNDVHWL